MITVIEQSTTERNNEIKELFQQIKPLLDDGYSYMGALVEIGKIERSVRNGAYHYSWYRDLREYGESQGYPYLEYSGRGRK